MLSVFSVWCETRYPAVRLNRVSAHVYQNNKWGLGVLFGYELLISQLVDSGVIRLKHDHKSGVFELLPLTVGGC